MKTNTKDRRAALRGMAGFAAGIAAVPAALSAGAARAAGQPGEGGRDGAVRATPFQGLRLRYDSALPFDEVLARLHRQLGEKPVDVHRIGQENADAAAFDRALQPHIGPTGFMLFAVFDHGGWMNKYGIARRELRLVFGNPLIAIGMLRYDLDAGLFVPVELLLTAGADERGCSVMYVQPSSLMNVGANAPLLAAAAALDDKVRALALAVTA